MAFTFPEKLLAGALALIFVSSSFDTVFAEVQIAGWRSSQYGNTNQWGHDQSDPSYWISVAQQMSTKFPGSTPGGILVVGEIDGPSGSTTSTFLPFPKPAGTYPNVIFGTTDTIEPLLDAYDNAGLKLYLQVESADADIPMLMDLIMNRYQHHPSVIGFGVDVEWYHEEQFPGFGRQLTDNEVAVWAAQVKTFDPSYRLMVKHWDSSYLANARPNNVLFLTDAENLGSLSNTINQYTAWIDHFGNAQVGFQIGYPSDISWWSTLQDPASSLMNPVIAARPSANIGAIFWVDFSVLAPFPDTGDTSITINDVTLDEGNFGTSNFVFTVTRSANTSTMSVQYQTTDNTATSPDDYTPISLTTLNFPSGGPLTQIITVPVNHDVIVEPDETFNVDLSNCTGGCIILDAQGLGTIKNDDLPGPLISSFGSLGSADGQFRSPLDVALDSTDRILVIDYNNQRIQIFNSAGNHIQSIGSFGSADGQFSYPTSIAVDSTDRILVADTGNNRIQIFNSAGSHIQSIGSFGSANGQFSSPTGITIRSEDRIAIADSGNHRIQTLVSSGAYLQSFGNFGSADGQFNFPSGIEVDSIDRVIVADTGNHRIQISQGSPPLDIDSDGIPDDSDTENIIDSSLTLFDSHVVIGNVTILDGVVLTIPNGQSLTIPSGNNITITSGGGVLIKSGGALQIIS
ncbi:MAG TPA: 6-bladed beta-propeller [Nitrosopumilaceae archaeon]|nr:6-bladed beta-propeller [Nitrosopumilaceae archaeon]